MKQKKVETLLYSSLGVVVMFAIIVAVNLISGAFKSRLDLTEGNIYTLSPGTKAILKRVDSPMEARFYFSQSEERLPSWAATYARQVEDLLSEFREASGGNIEIKKLDPQPDSDAEDLANLDGIEPQLNPQTGERFYFGLALSYDPQKVAVPLAPDRERLLEYDLARAVAQVITTNKPVVGVMSPLPVHGQPSNPMMMRMGQQGQEPWVILGELKRDFDVRKVEMDADHIEDAIKVLVVIHPKEIKDSAQYAIDQFVLRGGKLIAFLDPLSVLDQQGQQMGMPMPSTSTMEKLLKAWGLTFDTSKVVADLDYVGRTRQGRAPTVLALTEKAMNKDDILTSNTDNLFYVFGGCFMGTPAEGLSQTVLIKSSKNSQLVDPMMAQFTGEKMIQDFAKSGTEFSLALRLTGKFKTAFAEGKPKAAEPPADPAKPDEKKKEEKPAETGLKESAEDNSVILIGDCDMIQDQIAVQEMMNPFGGNQRMVMPANGNLAFAQSGVEQMTGDNNLIAVRSRASRERPFTVVKEMQAEAESNYQAKIKSLESSLQETQRKLNELQQTKQAEGGQRFILSPEQQAEIANFRKKESEAKAQLKIERKKLRAGIDSLENKVKWLNIAAMPIVVAVAGVGLAFVRRSRRAAR
jgi:ABC-type uncharacterized transport system involved in gliding motility auxiliary subunit